jgi:glyoxylate utilization-related uncharacterized protein
MKIEKKTWPEMFAAILAGKKTFDLRLADFKVKAGDILVLREYDPKTKTYTGRVLEKQITYVLKTKDIKFWNEEEVKKFGYVVMGIN